jgi:3-oxoacyl-[acyl-carrier protein] reductase
MKKVIVTGASGGIGKEIAKNFASNGYQTICFYNSNKDGVKELENWAFLSNIKGAIYPVKVNLSSPVSISNAYKKLIEKFKSIDVLVNNAGISLTKLITDTSLEEWNKVFDINMKSVFLLTNLVLEQMISKKNGKIINISSMWGVHGASMEVAYSASKSALIGYTKALAKEVGPSNINVNCVCPGLIDTKMNAHLSKEELSSLVDCTPLSRIGTPKDVANLVTFLASESANFITGECITIDGGFSL